MSAVLNELLDTGLRYAPEYRGGLSNHLPMALCALQALGADEDRLRGFFDRYVPRLSLVARDGAALRDWREGLGHADAYPALFERFQRMLAEQGAGAVLRAVLPQLMPGVGAAAFHGLIRTAYGVEAGHAGETAAGLAYWASRCLPLPASLDVADQPDPARWLEALAGAVSAELAGAAIEGGLIFERMRAFGRSNAFAHHAGRLVIDAQTLQALAGWAAQRYAATRNFTVLHLVTSCHALRLLLPWLGEHGAALRDYGHAYAAGVLASGADLHAPVLPLPPLGWADVVRRALASNDDHVIKLAYTCREEVRVYGDGCRLHAAALAVSG